MGNSCGKPKKQIPIKMEPFSSWRQYYEDDGNTVCRIRHNHTSKTSELIKTSGYKMPGNFLDVEEYVIENSPKHPRHDRFSTPYNLEVLRSRTQIDKPEQRLNVVVRPGFY
jgi:hypothetical protein